MTNDVTHDTATEHQDVNLPAIVNVSRLQALKIAAAVEADARLGVKSPEWMVHVAKLVEPGSFTITKSHSPVFKTTDVVSVKVVPTGKLFSGQPETSEAAVVIREPGGRKPRVA